MKCSNCGKEIKENEEILITDDYEEIYCADCFKENSFTTYTVDGEVVGDETNAYAYRNLAEAKRDIENEIEFWKKSKKNTESENLKDFFGKKIAYFEKEYKKLFG